MQKTFVMHEPPLQHERGTTASTVTMHHHLTPFRKESVNGVNTLFQSEKQVGVTIPFTVSHVHLAAMRVVQKAVFSNAQ